MSGTVFVPLRAELIDEGEFLGNLDAELLQLQHQLALFRRQFCEKAKGSVAKLQIEVQLKIEDVDDEGYSIKTVMKTTLPKRPASVSLAMGGQTDDGKMALFVRKAGSDRNYPTQLKLATRDGRIIDRETGEVLDERS